MSNNNIKSNSSIDQIRKLLDQGNPHEALKFVDRLGLKTPIIENARGVCLMRLGKTEQAVSLLRDIVFKGYVCIPSDTPALYQLNFAAALLMCNHKDAAIPILNKLDAGECPGAVKVKEAVSKWKENLNIFQKFLCSIGYYPVKKIIFDFPLGE